MKCYNELAELYDNLIYEDIDYNQWAVNIIKKCEEYGTKKEKYLDLACGTGNMTAALAKDFRKVWGVDLSSEMLSIAEDKLRGMGIKAHFTCMDICNLQLKDEFDLITCCLDSTNYILEDEDFVNYLKGVKKYLKDDGMFVFDINSEYKLKEILGNNTYSYDCEDIFYVWENVLEDDKIEVYLTFFVKDGQVYKRFDEFHTEKVYTEEYIEKILQKLDFEVIAKLNAYEEKTIDEECERITYMVKKKA